MNPNLKAELDLKRILYKCDQQLEELLNEFESNEDISQKPNCFSKEVERSKLKAKVSFMYTLLEAVNAEHVEELKERIEAYEALVISDEKPAFSPENLPSLSVNSLSSPSHLSPQTFSYNTPSEVPVSQLPNKSIKQRPASARKEPGLDKSNAELSVSTESDREILDFHKKEQDVISDQLLNYASSLKNNMQLFSQKLKEDNKHLQDAGQNLLDNQNSVTKGGKKITDLIASTRSSTWMILGMVLFVCLAFVFIFVFMRLFKPV